MVDSRQNQPDSEVDEARREYAEYVRNKSVIQLSPDPYGDFGIPVWHKRLPVPTREAVPSIDGIQVDIRKDINRKPSYSLHPRLESAICSLLAMKESPAFPVDWPDVSPEQLYTTLQGVLVDIPALIDMGLVVASLYDSFRLSSEGVRIASRFQVFCTLYDGEKSWT